MPADTKDIFAIVEKQNQWRGRECINLIASENTPSQAVRTIQLNDFMGRYAEGHPNFGGKINRYYQGTQYIDQIEKEVGMTIFLDQRRWYELKSRAMQDSMKQEYPSTPKEAFEVSNEGLYYGSLITSLTKENRITRVAYQPTSLVHTAWDIGHSIPIEGKCPFGKIEKNPCWS